MFIELIAAKGCYETFWGILSVLYAPFTNMSGFFSFIYKMFLKRIRASHHHNDSTTNHWRTGRPVPGWATSMGQMDAPIEKPLSATFHS